MIREVIIIVSMIISLGMIIVVGILNFSVEAAAPTSISVTPSSQTISADALFSINISCTPDQPIKAFEFCLSFNPSLVQANSISEGDIFDGYTTFFNSGAIDNNAGTIVDIYSLIIGSGNVSDNGMFVSISFTAKDISGLSSLDIYDAGVTDEEGYIPIDVSDGSISVQGSSPPGDGDGDGGGGGYSPPAGGGSNNNAPDIPMKPFGPTFIELGVEYEYFVVAVDPDGDDISYRIDWGDGNLSNWSEFTPSNTSVSMSYSWLSISTYQVKVIAQDKNGLNSSWSIPLNVTVSQAGPGGEPPVASITLPSSLIVNQTIVFDASGSFDEDGIIVSYFWDFGDGKNGLGVNPSHTYINPGEYNVTLIVTDNNGNIFSQSMIINVYSDEVEEEQTGEEKSALPFDIGIIFYGFGIILLFILVIYFREDIRSFVSSYSHYLDNLSFLKIWDPNYRIKRLDAKIAKLEKLRASIMYFKQSPVETNSDYSNELGEEYFNARKIIDRMIKPNSEDKKSIDEFDKSYSRENIDKQVVVESEHNIAHPVMKDVEKSRELDFRLRIDDGLFEVQRKIRPKSDIEKESKLDESDKEDIENKIDNYFTSKIRKKIDDWENKP